MAHAVQPFFDNGGTQLYVTRVYGPCRVRRPNNAQGEPPIGSLPDVRCARGFPGVAGNMQIIFASAPAQRAGLDAAPALICAASRQRSRLHQARHQQPR